MKIFIGLILMVCQCLTMVAQKPAYQLYDRSGKLVEYQQMIDSLRVADVVFFGEFHNNPIAHWLEFEVAKDLTAIHSGNLVLGAEMFEADDQIALNEYLSGLIKESSFKDEVKLWPNYATDYSPLIEWAKEKQLPFIATNIPRRYASMVSKAGFEALQVLNETARSWISPLPIVYNPELNCYKSMMNMSGMGGHGKVNENLPKAQAIKDATMAYFIMKNFANGKHFLHFNGAFHSDNHEGIVWYLNEFYNQQNKTKNKPLKIFVISMEEVGEMTKPNEETLAKGDFLILVPESMTKTY